jgi:hypothetical protein
MASFSNPDFLDFSNAAYETNPANDIAGLNYENDLVAANLTDIPSSGFRAVIYADKDRSTIVIAYRGTMSAKVDAAAAALDLGADAILEGNWGQSGFSPAAR